MTLYPDCFTQPAILLEKAYEVVGNLQYQYHLMKELLEIC